MSESADPAVVERLVASHREFLGFLEKRVGDRAVAEDLLQQAFVRGLDRLGDLRDDESVVAWFYRLLRNAVIDHHRRRASSGRRLEAFAAELQVAGSPEPEVRNAICGCISRLAGNLKPEYADALQRIEVEGAAVKDYATEKGLTAGNAAVRVHRAREALRRQVTRSCGTCAEHGCLDCTCQA